MLKKHPFITKDELERITKKYPTPFHIYDEAEIVRRVRLLQRAFSWNPGFREFFAIKATPNPTIIKLLRDLGCGCDCATATELVLADACGVTGSNIMLSSNDTPLEDFKRAAAQGAIINLDAGGDMLDTLDVALGGVLPDSICARFNPGGTFESANGIIGNPADAKFGMTEAQLFETFRVLRDRGVKVFGLHAFLASNAREQDYYPKLARILFELAVRLHRKLGIHIGFVDLSGGIGVAYRPEEASADVCAIGEGVRRAYEEVLVPENMDDVAIYSELGRWLLAPAGGLVTRVLHEKVTYHDYLGVDACAANLMRPAIYDAYHHITVMGAEDAPANHVYSVVGGLCENNDQFARDRALPKVHVGDLLFIHDTGAHGFSMGYNYNGKLRSAELLYHEDKTVELIRRAETMADYFATFDYPGSPFSNLAHPEA